MYMQDKHTVTSISFQSVIILNEKLLTTLYPRPLRNLLKLTSTNKRIARAMARMELEIRTVKILISNICAKKLLKYHEYFVCNFHTLMLFILTLHLKVRRDYLFANTVAEVLRTTIQCTTCTVFPHSSKP